MQGKEVLRQIENTMKVPRFKIGEGAGRGCGIQSRWMATRGGVTGQLLSITLNTTAPSCPFPYFNSRHFHCILVLTKELYCACSETCYRPLTSPHPRAFHSRFRWQDRSGSAIPSPAKSQTVHGICGQTRSILKVRLLFYFLQCSVSVEYLYRRSVYSLITDAHHQPRHDPSTDLSCVWRKIGWSGWS